MIEAADLADFDVFRAHVRARSSAGQYAAVLIAFAVLGVLFMVNWKSQEIGALGDLPFVEQYFTTVWKGEFNPVWWLLAWAPFALVPLAVAILVVQAVRRPAWLRPLHRDFLDRGRVAAARRTGLLMTRQTGNHRFTTRLVLVQGPELDEAQFEAAAEAICRVIGGLRGAEKQRVAAAFFDDTPITRGRDASRIFPGTPPGVLLVGLEMRRGVRRVIHVPNASADYKDVYPLR